MAPKAKAKAQAGGAAAKAKVKVQAKANAITNLAGAPIHAGTSGPLLSTPSISVHTSLSPVPVLVQFLTVLNWTLICGSDCAAFGLLLQHAHSAPPSLAATVLHTVWRLFLG